MQIHVSTRHLQLTGAINSFVAEKVSHLEDLTGNMIAVHVVLGQDEKSSAGGGSYYAKLHVALPGPDLHAEDSDFDLYAAIDKAMSKLARQLRKRKTKLVDKQQQKAQRSSERRKGKVGR